MSEHKHEVCSENEIKTLVVIIFTIIAMIAEIIYGYVTNSMALLADGYHMGTHALALSLTYIAYVLTRKLANSDKFLNGTDKIGTLTGYTSSIFLGLTGVWIIFEAIDRFIHPLNINFNDAILVAIIGLMVNGICIFIMEGKHKHYCKEEKHNHNIHDAHSEDYNYKAAYFHILADALTSILAIIALLIGKFFGILTLDPIIGILGGILIIRWAIGLLKDTITILIDMK
ncbi:MAG: CDF family Co(II)/Ni(II) efflux transporter DmeF [Candidatus Gastranaerophilales bacterium]|nr:CDF family Co(II)/Ni(II) efflux transporter DmeF [Candidatus Gastranaerophilales bacterium]